jgi:hypothetical protein
MPWTEMEIIPQARDTYSYGLGMLICSSPVFPAWGRDYSMPLTDQRSVILDLLHTSMSTTNATGTVG